MRNLATIQTIKDITPIPEKDKIVLASFIGTGWKVIVGVDMKPGDKVVYCEPDTILPQKSEFEFLRKRCFNAKWNGFRIKRMLMAGVLSEGIAFPLKEVSGISDRFKDGQDVTDIIGAIKYDPELLEEQNNTSTSKYPKWMQFCFRIPFLKKILLPRTKSSWPQFVSKTDETRIQTLQYVFDSWKHEQIYITEKVDGQSATYALKDNDFYICSRNVCLSRAKIRKASAYKNQMNNYFETAKRNNIAQKLKKFKKNTGHNIYIQGEQMGPGIQGNKYNLPTLRFFIFNVYDITEKRYFSGNDVRNFCIEYGFDMVPFLCECTFEWNTTEELVEYAKGDSKLGDGVSTTPREGIVIRTRKVKDPEIRMSNMASFKVINSDFLKKYNLE
jgi:hypothetical protein